MPTPQEQQALESKLQILFDASATLIGSLRMEDLLPKVLDLARKLNAAEACSVWRHEPDTFVWRIAAAVGLSSEYQKVTIHSTSGIIGERPFCFEDVSQIPLEAGRRELYEA